MRQGRCLAEWRNSENKPVLYHCISRVMDRRFVLGTEEQEKFRTPMRMQENFSGCRVASYCLMDSHFHILLEVPLMPEGGLSAPELLKRLSFLYSEAFVAGVAAELAEARAAAAEGIGEKSFLVEKIHERFTYRMQNLGEFMKGSAMSAELALGAAGDEAHQDVGLADADKLEDLILRDLASLRDTPIVMHGLRRIRILNSQRV